VYRSQDCEKRTLNFTNCLPCVKNASQGVGEGGASSEPLVRDVDCSAAATFFM